MRKIISILIFVSYSSYCLSECEYVSPTIENPNSELPDLEEFLTSYADGLYEFEGRPPINGGAILQYWHAEKVTFPELARYRSESSGSTVGYSLNGCLAINESGPGVHCMYLESFTKTCPIGYELQGASGDCELVDLQACMNATPEFCEDGFPPNLNGYYGCDRPDLMLCSDGTYARQDIGICPTSCTDYLSCFEEAVLSSNCEADQLSNFEYINPGNWTLQCNSISPESPDHPDLGGNGDGNPFNDPSTPDEGSGSTLDTAHIDPYSLAGMIRDELTPEFSNVERAIRDDIDQSKINTGAIESAINEVQESLDNNRQFDENNASTIIGTINQVGAKIDSINEALNSGPCDPNLTNYIECISPPPKDLPPNISAGVGSYEEAMTNFRSRITSSNVVQAFSDMTTIISLDNAICPGFSINLESTIINKNISTTIHCDLMESVKPILSAVMLIIYTWIAFRIFASS
ncbi:hypothetical protein [Agaribacterium sp. ZY112]|uniref:hypothetical protein n=1 Tax=Agaribacterium sp. ZY112 TaxID=3233574 RepID=UPI0035250CC0